MGWSSSGSSCDLLPHKSIWGLPLLPVSLSDSLMLLEIIFQVEYCTQTLALESAFFRRGQTKTDVRLGFLGDYFLPPCGIGLSEGGEIETSGNKLT